MAPINLNASRLIVPVAGIRTLQLMTIGMISAVASFLVIAPAFAALAGSPPFSREAATLLDFLSLLHVVVAALCSWLAGILYTRALTRRPGENEAGGEEEDPLGRLRRAMLIRLALLEVPAVFGFAICLIGVVRGVLPHEPVYWLNLISAVGFLGVAVFTFPSRSRVEYQLSKIAP